MQIFLSHSWNDKPLVYALSRALDQLAPSATIWLDGDRISPGDRILDRVEDALEASSVVAVIWTPSAAASDGVRHELDHLQNLDVPVVFCSVSGPAMKPPALPNRSGWGARTPHTLRLSDPWDEENIGLVAGALIEIATEALDAEPEMSMPGTGGMWLTLRRIAANLRHLSEAEIGADPRKHQWADQLRHDVAAMDTKGSAVMGELQGSLSYLERVLAAVQATPTNELLLRRLIDEADSIQTSDPAAAKQALVVLRARLAEPRR